MSGTVHADEAFFRERGFGLKIGFGKSPGLIIVDIIRAFTDPDMPLGSNMDAEIEATNQLIDACREADVPVFFTPTAYDDAALRAGGIGVQRQKGAETERKSVE